MVTFFTVLLFLFVVVMFLFLWLVRKEIIFRTVRNRWVYLVLVFVINRFWVATAVFAITMSIYAVANSTKIILRNEPILPSDLSFLSSGNGGNHLIHSQKQPGIGRRHHHYADLADGYLPDTAIR